MLSTAGGRFEEVRFGYLREGSQTQTCYQCQLRWGMLPVGNAPVGNAPSPVVGKAKPVVIAAAMIN